jgi:hypothetical protein
MQHNSYEIAVFKYSDFYDGNSTVEESKVIEEFMKQYSHYFCLEYYKEKDIRFTRSRLWLSYTDKSGGDKPKTIFLIGHITDELVSLLTEKVKTFYKRYCYCGDEIDIDRWALCKICRNKM